MGKPFFFHPLEVEGCFSPQEQVAKKKVDSWGEHPAPPNQLLQLYLDEIHQYKLQSLWPIPTKC